MPYLAVIIAMVIWAGSGIAVKAALLSLSPMALILTRFSIAVLLMLAIGLAFRGNTLLGLQDLQLRQFLYTDFGGGIPQYQSADGTAVCMAVPSREDYGV